MKPLKYGSLQPGQKEVPHRKTFLPSLSSYPQNCSYSMKYSGQPDGMMQTDSLIIQACNGDEQARSRLVQLWYKRIYNYCYKFFMDHDLAMEATQKTFISMYRNLSSLQDTGRFKSWLYTICVNQCREEMRKHKKDRAVSLDTDYLYVHDESAAWEKALHRHENPEREYARQELAELMQQCLKELSDEQREVIIMKEYEGMKFREIADVLNIPENTAKSRLYYGLSALKKILEKRNITIELLNDEN
ncbi:MAG: RNA polymerase sigma factor [Cyclobacteriaceae bacterium]|nr:RNA polymerase sigma factor [Cyclobacteriaceae bacterium]MDW8330074.1 RNA polymerase sigma factor [Cyclobacteriaceae bacterium]